MSHVICGAFQGGACGKESACQWKRCKRQGFYPWVWKIPWSRKQKPTPAFLPGKFQGQRSLVGYSPWVQKELDTTEHTHTQLYTHIHAICRIYTKKKNFVHYFFEIQM